MASGGASPALLSWMAGWLRRRPYRGRVVADAAADAVGDAPALKDVIARKRHNEAVRQREFEHLRQLRKRGIGGGMPPPGAQLPLFDALAGDVAPERTQTLRKIDRAEAQMAHRHGSAARADEPAGASGAEDAPMRVSGFAPTVQTLEDARSVDVVAPVSAWRPRMPAPPAVPQPEPESDAVLEDAALRWALGDAAAAASVLQAALRNARSRDRCHVVRRAALFALLHAGGLPQAQQDALREFAGPFVAPPLPAGAADVVLEGQLSGDIDAVLASPMRPRQASAVRLEVACGRLTRVDFAAAGCLLDWAQAHQASGCQVQFRDVSPLVAAFLCVVGLTEHARVVPQAG